MLKLLMICWVDLFLSEVNGLVRLVIMNLDAVVLNLDRFSLTVLRLIWLSLDLVRVMPDLQWPFLIAEICFK